MQRSRSLSAGLLSLSLAVVSTTLAAACSEDGATAKCPELKTLYDIGAAGERNAPEVDAERRAAADAGCVTELAQPAAP